MEEDDVDLWHVEHPQRHRGRQAERYGQGGSLNIHLRGGRQRDRKSHLSHFKLSEVVCVIVQPLNKSDEG